MSFHQMGHPDEPIFLVNERDQEFYVVEAILGRRWNELKETNEYKIKWKYWASPDHDSWEEEHRLKYCDKLKMEFDRTHPGKRFFNPTDCINYRAGYRVASMSTTVAKKPKNVTRSSAKSRQKSHFWKATTCSTAMQSLAHQESATTSASSKRDRALLGLSKEADASPLLKVTLARSDQGYSVKQPSSAEKTVRSKQAPQNQELATNSLSARKEQVQAMSSTNEYAL
ncbi:hypothetical protein AAVH_04944 [Aphelenchoides avenae]|nr:hypothetical protein AAVH_04944 [Aphelenchus avenae]